MNCQGSRIESLNFGATVVRSTKAPLKPDALQTLRDLSGARILAKRLECGCLQHRFWLADGHTHASDSGSRGAWPEPPPRFARRGAPGG